MKFAEINKRYTEIIAEYLSKGYTINAGTMSGSQGEIAHIDLTDGNSIIRVLVCEEVEYEDRKRLDTLQIIVGKCTDERVVINNEDRFGNTVWNSSLEVIHCEKYYKLSRYSSTGGTEYGTKEEAEIAEKKRTQRYSNRPTDYIDLTHKYLELGKKIVEREWGKKKVRSADVKVYKRNNSYYVSYKYDSRSYKLH